MISKEDYTLVSAGWTGKVYQKYKKLKKRVPMLLRHWEFFEGENILEIGANAGMYAWHLGVFAKSYKCVEPDKNYFNQLKYTAKSFDRGTYGCSYYLSNKKFGDIKLDEHVGYTLFMASYVIHHFSIHECIKLIDVFKRFNKVVIHTRSGDPLKYGHDEIGKQPFSNWNLSEIKKMLDAQGYESELHLRKPSIYDGIYLILAEKK